MKLNVHPRRRRKGVDSSGFLNSPNSAVVNEHTSVIQHEDKKWIALISRVQTQQLIAHHRPSWRKEADRSALLTAPKARISHPGRKQELIAPPSTQLQVWSLIIHEEHWWIVVKSTLEKRTQVADFSALYPTATQHLIANQSSQRRQVESHYITSSTKLKLIAHRSSNQNTSCG